MTTLICPVRPGDHNEELRYALRSWETNLILPSGLTLMTVGYKPTWLNPDIHVEGNAFESAPMAVFDNVLRGAVAAAEAGLEEVVYMNDDFFCMDPVGAILPVRRNCSLRDHIRAFGGQSQWWPKSLTLTLNWLAERGYTDPPSYEVHRPLIAKASDMVTTLQAWEGGMTSTLPQWRTMYGVLNEIEAHPVGDAKLSPRQTGFGTPWVSTSDQTWRRHAAVMHRRFQKPSHWEV